MVDMILFPSSYFGITKVDEDLQAEYEAAKATGLYNSILFGYDAWFNESILKINDKPEKMSVAVYRGWMMQPDIYENFY